LNFFFRFETSIENIEFLPQQDSHQILFVKFRETFGLFKIEFSPFLSEYFTCLYFTSFHLKNHHPEKCLNFLLFCERNSTFHSSLILLLNYLIKNERDELMLKIILQFSIKSQDNIQYESILRRVFIYCVLINRFDDAFEISHLYSNTKMFEDLYFISKENQVLSVSYLSFLKTNKVFQQRIQSLNLLLEKSEINQILPTKNEFYEEMIGELKNGHQSSSSISLSDLISEEEEEEVVLKDRHEKLVHLFKMFQ
jgi:hypothetical protein